MQASCWSQYLHSPRLDGNTCTLPECCAARHGRARPKKPTKEIGRQENSIIITTTIVFQAAPELSNQELDKRFSVTLTRLCHTCWKMHSWGKVLEMSSLISSRLDSRSEEPKASGRRTGGNVSHSKMLSAGCEFLLSLYLQVLGLCLVLPLSSISLWPERDRCCRALQENADQSELNQDRKAFS